jgi:transcriptional regulator with GAF, ATPase, and Fis domain
VRVLSGLHKDTSRVIEGHRFRIGKAPDNDLVLTDPTVSRNHCEILRDGRGFLLRDCNSTNGTLLDGREIKEAYLKPGEIITCGDVELKVQAYAERVEVPPSDKTSFGQVVGRSLAMREIFGLLERLAPTDITVLLGGETGTGKDLLARAIHEASHRRGGPFVVVDCGAVVGTLIESELFGHEKGAYTGATVQRQGAFEVAHGGTLFLDEIGELPLDLQPKLLRVLEQRTLRRVGGNREIHVDIRVIAASKRNLRMEVERGKFREDLFFRLAVVEVEVPPLRARREDVPLLVETLLARIDGHGPQPLKVRPEVVDVLAGHDWPGNVRELRNVLERAANLARTGDLPELTLAHLPFVSPPPRLTGAEGDPMGLDRVSLPRFEPGLSYRDMRTRWEREFERRYVAWLLARHSGNISAAAREAEMDRKYLHKLAKKHGLHRGDGGP